MLSRSAVGAGALKSCNVGIALISRYLQGTTTLATYIAIAPVSDLWIPHEL